MIQDIIYPDQNILIVDDNKNNILLLETMLKSHNFGKVYSALSALEAYKILEDNKDIDAILLDVMMPDIDGIQACRTIRSNPEYNLIPILMVTANSDNETLRQSFDAGANEFIEKPINDVALMGRLNSQLRQRNMEKSIIQSSRFTAKDEMISMLAHQWRQPLSHISILSSSIKTGIELHSIVEKEIVESLDDIEVAVQSLSDLISSFTMAFANKSQKTWININLIIDNLLILMHPLLRQYNINLIRNTKDMGEIMLDKQSLLQVLINLLNNSIESLKEYAIDNPTIHIEVGKKDQELIIKVIDNGKGIDKEALSLIFDPYYSTKVERNGKGLGLYIAKQLVSNNLGGTISLSSVNHLTIAKITLNLESTNPTKASL